MPGPYSLDLRIRVVEAYLSGEGTYAQVAERFQVGVATVSRWVSRTRRQGHVAPDPMGGDRNGKFDEASEAHLARMVEENPNLLREEMVERLDEELGLKVSYGAVQRALVRLGLTRKKRRSMRRNATPNA